MSEYPFNYPSICMAPMDALVSFQLSEYNVGVRSGLCGGWGLLCCFSVSAMAQLCGSTFVIDDSRLFTLSVDLRL